LIGLDTNILVRYVVRDDPFQTAQAEQLIDSLTDQNPGYVTFVALAEFSWVLDRRYKIDRDALKLAIDWLVNSSEILLQGQENVAKARQRFGVMNGDFGDCLIECCSHAAGCTATFTFDRNAAKSSGMTLL
jgi:predicted nucleic-acid-binding protein